MILFLFLFLYCFFYASADVHMLNYFYTAVPAGINFPEFIAFAVFDEEPIMCYKNSNSGALDISKWIENCETENYWKSLMQDMQNNQDNFNKTFVTVLNGFNHGKGIHTLQRIYGCELHDDNTTRRYDQYSYDGEDFMGFNVLNATWTVANDNARTIAQKWDANGYTRYWKNFLENDCIDQLQKFVSYGRETLERKVHPIASVFQKHSSPEVVCHATGFFPKTVMITWQKDGEDVHEDVELRETLPNQDGSFQKRSILTVSAEDLQKHTYTCVIQHSSLKKEMVLEVPKDGGSGGVLVVIGIIVVLVLIASGVGFLICNNNNSGGVQNVIIPGGVSVTTSMFVLLVLLRFLSGRRMTRWSEDCHRWFRCWSHVEVSREEEGDGV
ncbi:major histocompatibility complex class I-related gene protein [Ictalurus furcatus]|uniref:major histocompatibility complex class I-related gene protein n=1 Tax=Ictalurus furcatus TaxID=66913 RepID=UPI0023504E80|nr:major histocompatibility complex class I-related gene protein [Ictalurus furcatus]